MTFKNKPRKRKTMNQPTPEISFLERNGVFFKFTEKNPKVQWFAARGYEVLQDATAPLEKYVTLGRIWINENTLGVAYDMSVVHRENIKKITSELYEKSAHPMSSHPASQEIG